jgi:hypothetical protein
MVAALRRLWRAHSGGDSGSVVVVDLVRDLPRKRERRLGRLRREGVSDEARSAVTRLMWMIGSISGRRQRMRVSCLISSAVRLVQDMI